MNNNEMCRRAFTRIAARVALKVRRLASGEVLSGYTQAVSMNGFAIEGIEPIPVGEIVEVDLFVGDRNSGVKIEVNARIANVHGFHMGAEIISHLAMESYYHLERLVLFRSGDEAEVIEGEIARQKDKS